MTTLATTFQPIPESDIHAKGSQEKRREPHAPTHNAAAEPFPLACLPEPFQGMAREVARITTTPHSLAGCMTLGLLASAIGRGLGVESGERRITYGNLFLLISAESGSGKSETFRHIFAPFKEFEKALAEKWARETEPSLQARKKVVEGQLKSLEREAVKALKGKSESWNAIMDQLTKLHSELTQIEKDLLGNRLSAEDCTVEKLAVLLQSNDESISLLSSDARSVVSNLLGRNNQLKDVDDSICIKMYSGDTCRVDRIGRPPVTLCKPIGNITLAVQPDKVSQLISNEEIREGGLLPRFLACHSGAEMEYESEKPAPIDPQLVKDFDSRVMGLLEKFRSIGVKRDLESVRMESDGLEVLRSFKNSIVTKVKSGELSDVQSFAARYAEQAWKLSVVLHAGKWGELATNREIDEQTAVCAVKLANWFSEQQLQILVAVRADARREKHDKIMALFDQRPDGITSRDVQRARITQTAEQAKRLLDEIVQEGNLNSETVATGGHPKTIYRRKE